MYRLKYFSMQALTVSLQTRSFHGRPAFELTSATHTILIAQVA